MFSIFSLHGSKVKGNSVFEMCDSLSRIHNDTTVYNPDKPAIHTITTHFTVYTYYESIGCHISFGPLNESGNKEQDIYYLISVFEPFIWVRFAEPKGFIDG